MLTTVVAPLDPLDPAEPAEPLEPAVPLEPEVPEFDDPSLVPFNVFPKIFASNAFTLLSDPFVNLTVLVCPPYLKVNSSDDDDGVNSCSTPKP